MDRPASQKQEWIDLSFLRIYSGDNKEVMKKFILAFLERTPAAIAMIEEQLAAKDFHALARTVHSLKPQLSYVGITALSETVTAIEESARDMMQTDVISSHLDKMKLILNNAYEELRNELNTL